MTDFPVTVFHNPACGTSRNVLAMIEAAGYRSEVVDYLKRGWTADQLRGLFAEAGITAREALREKVRRRPNWAFWHRTLPTPCWWPPWSSTRCW